MTSTTMTNQEFLTEIQSIQKDIMNISSISTSHCSTKESLDVLQHTKMKLKLLKKGLKTENDQTRKLVVKTYYKKLKRVEKDFFYDERNDWVLNDLKKYTVKPNDSLVKQTELEMKQEEEQVVPSMVPTSTEEESMEEQVEEIAITKQSMDLLDSINDKKETSDYECFNICHIS